MIPAFVINLDRRPDRLAYMAAQLDGLRIGWTRVPALDARTATDAEIGAEVALAGHRIAMGRGSQACAVTTFGLLRRIVAERIPAALVLQDDVALSARLPALLASADWLPGGIGLVQLEWTGRRGRRLVGPPLGALPLPGHALHRLHSRTGGAAAFVVTQAAARTILAEKPLLDMPIDHLLFSPNVSPLFDRLGVGIVLPALAVQRPAEIASDLVAERAHAPRGARRRLARAASEVNRLPAQLLAMARGARWRRFGPAPDLPGGADG